MIKTLIFDFGDVFINLDKVGAMKNALERFKMETLSEELVAINTLYEPLAPLRVVIFSHCDTSCSGVGISDLCSSPSSFYPR